ncbi:MAG: hypothetical protein ACRCU9_14680, partial [Iodobacter sp.]
MLENLDILPKDSDAFFWSDFAEIITLTHPDKCFSRGDLFRLAKQNTTKEKIVDVEERWRCLINYCDIRSHEFKHSYPFKISEDKDTLLLDFSNTAPHRLYLSLLISASMRNLPNKRKG